MSPTKNSTEVLLRFIDHVPEQLKLHKGKFVKTLSTEMGYGVSSIRNSINTGTVPQCWYRAQGTDAKSNIMRLADAVPRAIDECIEKESCIKAKMDAEQRELIKLAYIEMISKLCLSIETLYKLERRQEQFSYDAYDKLAFTAFINADWDAATFNDKDALRHTLKHVTSYIRNHMNIEEHMATEEDFGFDILKEIAELGRMEEARGNMPEIRRAAQKYMHKQHIEKD